MKKLIISVSSLAILGVSACSPAVNTVIDPITGKPSTAPSASSSPSSSSPVSSISAVDAKVKILAYAKCTYTKLNTGNAETLYKNAEATFNTFTDQQLINHYQALLPNAAEICKSTLQ